MLLPDRVYAHVWSLLARLTLANHLAASIARPVSIMTNFHLLVVLSVVPYLVLRLVHSQSIGVKLSNTIFRVVGSNDVFAVLLSTLAFGFSLALPLRVLFIRRGGVRIVGVVGVGLRRALVT